MERGFKNGYTAPIADSAELMPFLEQQMADARARVKVRLPRAIMHAAATFMQDPAWRAKFGLSPKPLHFPGCFDAGMYAPATESDTDMEV